MLDPDKKLFRWGPISACPLFMDYTVQIACTSMGKSVGMSYPETVAIFKDGKVTWLMDNEVFFDQSVKFANNVTLDSKNFAKYLKQWRAKRKKLYTELDKLATFNFNTCSDIDLVNAFNLFSSTYYDWYSTTLSLELASVALEPMLGTALKKYLDEEEQRNEFQEAFAVLTSPLKLTFYRREEFDLLSILSLPNSKRDEALQKHQKEYFWMFNSYAKGKVIPVSYFREQLEGLETENPGKILTEIKKYTAEIQKKKNSIIRNLGISDSDASIANAISLFSEMQDERKEDNFKADHYLELFVKAFARRSNADPEDIKMLLPAEVAVSINSIDRDAITRRKKCYLFHCTNQGVKSYDGDEANAIAKDYLVAKNINESMIHGRVASLGKHVHFRGTAKVVLTIDEIDKVNEGDILVTTMTSPDFVIGMKKAGAIITDVGGILSHAAVVSREFKIPCIVGTQIATKVITDGDVVELHCGRGTVKIIKHS